MTNKRHTYGKIIWMGEHSVVYGHPALALPLRSAKVIAEAVPSPQDRLISPFYDGLLDMAPVRFESLRVLIRNVRQALELGPQTLRVTTQLPIGAGLGASAAVAGALVKALYQAKNVPLGDHELREWIQTSEMIAHGRASGVDAATVLSDTLLTYVKGQDPLPLIANVAGYLFVADSGVFGSTKEAVEIVRKQMETESGKVHVEALGRLAKDFIDILNQSEFSSIGRFMNEAQAHLRELNVSHPALEEMIGLALSTGAKGCLLYTSPSPRDRQKSRMPSSA